MWMGGGRVGHKSVVALGVERVERVGAPGAVVKGSCCRLTCWKLSSGLLATGALTRQAISLGLPFFTGPPGTVQTTTTRQCGEWLHVEAFHVVFYDQLLSTACF